MRGYICNTSNKKLTPITKDQIVKAGVTNRYVELEYKTGKNTYFVVYLIPKDRHSLFVASNCEGLEEFFDIITPGLFKEELRVKPTLKELLENGFKSRYSRGALISGEDLDTSDPTWFIATVVGNLDIENPEDWVDERVQEAEVLIAEKVHYLNTEFGEKNPSFIRAALSDIKHKLIQVSSKSAEILYKYLVGGGADILFRKRTTHIPESVFSRLRRDPKNLEIFSHFLSQVS